MGLPLQDAPELWRETSQVLESVSKARPRDVSDVPGRLHRRAKVLITKDIGSWSTGWYLTLSEVRHAGRMVYFLHPASRFSTMHGECRAIAAAERPLITGAYESDYNSAGICRRDFPQCRPLPGRGDPERDCPELSPLGADAGR
jgi:hypothetical protein